MLLSQVEGFVEVARQRHLSRAAEALFITQPALSARIASLEQELGEALFSRSRRGMELTDAGRAFLPYAERALESLRSGGALVGELQQGTAGELAVGAAPAVSTYVLPRLLVLYTQRFPNVRLVVRTGHSEEILEMAIRREVDVGIIRALPAHPLVRSWPLYEDELVLVVPPGHAFAADSSVPIQRIADDRLILFDRTSSYYDLTNSLFRGAGVAPRGTMELDNIDAAKQMVEAELGVALLPRTAVAAELAAGTLVLVRLEGAQPIRRRIVAIRRRDATVPTRAVAGFLEVLGEIEDVLPGKGSS